MKQKLVIKVQLCCDKCRSKAMKIAAAADGVSSVALEGDDKDKVVVVGDGVDAAELTCTLRKKFNCASLLSVEEVKPKKKDGGEDNKPAKKPTSPKHYCLQPCYPAIHCDLCRVVVDPNPPVCTLM